MSDEPEVPATDNADKPLPRVTLEQALDDSGVLERWAVQHAREVSQELANRSTARLLAAWDATRPGTLDLTIQRGMPGTRDWGSHPLHHAEVERINMPQGTWINANGTTIRFQAPRDLAQYEIIDLGASGYGHALHAAKQGEYVDVRLSGRLLYDSARAGSDWSSMRVVNSWGDGDHAPYIEYAHTRPHMHRLLFQVFNDKQCDDWTQARVSGSRWVLRVNRAHLSDSTVGELCRLAFAVDCEIRRVGVQQLDNYDLWQVLLDFLGTLVGNNYSCHNTRDVLQALLLAAQAPTSHAEEYSIDASAHADKAQPLPSSGFIYGPIGALSPEAMFGGHDYSRCRINNVLMHDASGKPHPEHGSVKLEPRVSDDGVVLVWKQEASDGTQQATQ